METPSLIESLQHRQPQVLEARTVFIVTALHPLCSRHCVLAAAEVLISTELFCQQLMHNHLSLKLHTVHPQGRDGAQQQHKTFVAGQVSLHIVK
jgi:hypothetical protein